MTDEKNVVGRLICEARDRHGLTQRALAARVQVSQSTVAAWESGTRTPGLDDLERLSAALGKPVAWFLGPQALGIAGSVADADYSEAALGAFLAGVVKDAMTNFKSPEPAPQGVYPQLSEDNARLMFYVEKAAPDLLTGEGDWLLTDETVGRLRDVLKMWAASVRR